MSYGIKLHIWGEFACFTRPEMKVERVSYDVITPSAARGIIEAIYWKPEIKWVIDRVHVLKPIKFTNLRRNELSSKASASAARTAMKRGSGNLGQFIEQDRQQRAATILCDVAYVIEAHFEVKSGEDDEKKHYNMIKRRAEKGQCFHHPYLGCREFACSFAWVDELPKSDLPDGQRERDFGYMLHDIDFENDMTPHFFRAQMRDCAIEVPPLKAEEVCT